MNIKKILSSVLSISLLTASITLPVFADYTSSVNDIVKATQTFDDGTAINTIDNSNALQVTDYTAKIFEASINTTQEFFLSFDFRMDADNALIEIPKYKSSGVDKVGPRLKLLDGQLVTETSSSKTRALGECVTGTWYTAEIEGRTGMGQEHSVFRLYSYTDGVKTLVQETTNFYMRNLSSDGLSFNGMGVTAASIDNIMLVSEYPDTLTITSDDDSVDAGQALTLDYAMTRNDVETTKYAVEWKLYEEDGTTELSADVASMTDSTLVADIDAATQVVAVKASVVFGDEAVGEKTLVGEKKVTINAVDTSAEKFDAITIRGADTMKAGTSEAFTVEATKGGNAVALTDGDVVWSLYDAENINPYANSNISIENGVLTVKEGTLPHEISVRASTPSGKVFSTKKVTINFADSQTEEVIFYDAYEANIALENKETSVDGSTAYYATATIDPWSPTNYSEYLLTELDIKFTANGAGITLMRRDGKKTNTDISYSDGVIKTSSTTLLTDANTDTWYHLEIVYSSGQANASCNVYAYAPDGTLGEAVASLDIDRRDGSSYGRLRIKAGACVDNVKISKPSGNAVEVTAPKQFMFAGETAQFSAEVSRNGLPLKGAEGLEWVVLDESMLPILDETITVSETGLVTAGTNATPQTVTVQAKTASGDTGTAQITIQAADVFEIKNFGINEEKTKIVRLYVDKNFYYDDEVTFILAIYGENGMLKGIKTVQDYGDSYAIGENEIVIDYDIPGDFNPETDKIKTFVWTGLV